MDDKLQKCGTEPMNADHFIHLHWPSHDKIKMLLIEVVKERDEQWRAMSAQAPGMEAMQARLKDAEGLIDEYGIDTVGTGSAPSKKEQAHVDKIVHAICERAALQAAERVREWGE